MTLADGIVAQTRQTLANIGRILDAAGADWDDVAKVNVYLNDMDDFAAMNEAYGAFFADYPGEPPARITFGGIDLALGALVEMDCVATASAPASTAATTNSAAVRRRRAGTVDREGESIFFEVLGDGGVPLVLSHGRRKPLDLVPVAAHFAADRTVVLWDHRGYGRSTDRAGARVA